ncbi:MAG: hypothetical protein ACP5HQ_00835 [Thermoprotei archaeon]
MATEPLLGQITASEVVQLVIAFLLGLLIGFLVRNLVKIGLILLAIVILLIVAGFVTPAQVESWINSILANLHAYVSSGQNYLGYLPYNSLAFVIGFIIGLIKG